GSHTFDLLTGVYFFREFGGAPLLVAQTFLSAVSQNFHSAERRTCRRIRIVHAQPIENRRNGRLKSLRYKTARVFALEFPAPRCYTIRQSTQRRDPSSKHEAQPRPSPVARGQRRARLR